MAIEAEDWQIGSLSEAMSTADDAIKCKICLGPMRLVKYQKEKDGRRWSCRPVVKQEQLGKFNFIRRDFFHDGYNMLHH